MANPSTPSYVLVDVNDNTVITRHTTILNHPTVDGHVYTLSGYNSHGVRVKKVFRSLDGVEELLVSEIKCGNDECKTWLAFDHVFLEVTQTFYCPAHILKIE